MLVADLVFIVLFSVLLSVLVIWGLGWRHPASYDAVEVSLLFLFLILFFSMLGGGAWVGPWGPVAYGSSWLIFLIIGLFVSLLVMATAAPVQKPRKPSEAVHEAGKNTAMAAAFGLFFWVLLLALLISITARYIFT